MSTKMIQRPYKFDVAQMVRALTVATRPTDMDSIRRALQIAAMACPFQAEAWSAPLADIDMAPDVEVRDRGAADELSTERGRQYAPADFLREFATIIAVCLSLALAARLLVSLVGPYPY